AADYSAQSAISLTFADGELAPTGNSELRIIKNDGIGGIDRFIRFPGQMIVDRPERIIGTAGNDSFAMQGDVGSNRLRSDMTLEGGDGNDQFNVGADTANDGHFALLTLLGGNGNDYFVAYEDFRPVRILGGAGDDYLNDMAGYAEPSFQSGDSIDLGPGFDTDDVTHVTRPVQELEALTGVEKLIGGGSSM